MPSKQPATGNDPALPDDCIAHETAEAVLALGDHYLIVGSIDMIDATDTGAGPPSPGDAAFEDDAHYSAWAVELDGRGQPMWERMYRATRECHARAVAALPDGFIIAGEHRDGGDREYQGWMMRITRDGGELWRRVLGRPGVTALHAVVASGDGSIIAAGTQEGRGWVVALDEAGALRWEREIEEVDEVTALVGHAGGVVLAGITGRTTTEIGVSRLIGLDASGATRWSTTVPAEGRGELAALAALPGGGVAVGQGQGDGRRGAWVVRFGWDGAVTSSEILPGAYAEAGRAVVAAADGGYAIAGDSFEHVGDRRGRLWRMDASGAVLWHHTYGSSGHDLAAGVAFTDDGGLLAAGTMLVPQAGKTRLLAIRFDAAGKEAWQLARGRS